MGQEIEQALGRAHMGMPHDLFKIANSWAQNRDHDAAKLASGFAGADRGVGAAGF
jgi:hypothetical protein